MTVDEMLARESIRHRIASYNIAGDSMCAEAFAGAFTEDAIFEFDGFASLPPFRFEGRTAIRESIAGWRVSDAPAAPVSRLSFVRHHITTCLIDLIGPDSAKAHTYWTGYTDIGLDHFGYYNDIFARVGVTWLIAHRKIRVDWRSPESIFPPAAA